MVGNACKLEQFLFLQQLAPFLGLLLRRLHLLLPLLLFGTSLRLPPLSILYIT